MAPMGTHDNSVVPDAASGHFSGLARNDWEAFGSAHGGFCASKWISGWLGSASRSAKGPGCRARRGEKTGKNIFVEVGVEWCTWCHILDRFFDEHPNLEALRDKNYIPMKVSISQENSN